jgi:hypothetical protein
MTEQVMEHLLANIAVILENVVSYHKMVAEMRAWQKGMKSDLEAVIVRPLQKLFSSVWKFVNW